MAVVDGHGLPLAVTIHSASPAEVRLAPEVFTRIPSKRRPRRAIGDKAYDSNALRAWFQDAYGVELIAPNRRGRRKTQDGRSLRRYRRRWKVERLFAWLGNYRRVVVRWDRHVHNYFGFVTLACILIMLRHL